MKKTRALILAAGKGVRMRSDLPKVLHPLMGHPLVWHVCEAARKATGERPVVVVGYGADQVKAALGDSVDYVYQDQQLGTGHAVLQAEQALRGQVDQVLVAFGDMPLLSAESLRQVSDMQSAHAGPMTMMTIIQPNARGFGRIVRDDAGKVAAIVEEAQATPEQLKIIELNPSIYCLDSAWLWEALRRIPLSPKGEYYLTDLVGLAVGSGLHVQTAQMEDVNEAIGINNRVHLAEAGALLRQRINTEWMLAGITLIDPQTTYIEPDVQIGVNSVIWPNTYLHGKTVIGANCTIGPNSIIHNAQIGAQCEIISSVLDDCVVEDGASAGPFARLRKGAHLGAGVHMGNFGEVKNSYLAPGTKMGHFSYIGDAQIGEDTNIGAGTITCNFDGKRKHKTQVGKGVFIGSDTLLVAPVTLGDGARTGAGSVVTHDVPEETLVVGVPARQLRKVEKND